MGAKFDIDGSDSDLNGDQSIGFGGLVVLEQQLFLEVLQLLSIAQAQAKAEDSSQDPDIHLHQCLFASTLSNCTNFSEAFILFLRRHLCKKCVAKLTTTFSLTFHP